MRTARWIARIALSLAASAGLAMAEAPACPFSRSKPCIVDLHGPGAPSASAECESPEWKKILTFTLPGRIQDANGDGWSETVMEVELDPTAGCGCATFRVYFEEPVRSFSVNIGDSPTNNGYGGDEGTTFREAEMELRGSTLRVYSASKHPGSGIVDKILEMELPRLSGRFTDIEVCDQSLGFSMPGGLADGREMHWKVQTPTSGMLYDLFPRTARDALPGAKKRDAGIYAAFNRVIHDKSGSPRPATRFGTGVRRIEVRLSP